MKKILLSICLFSFTIQCGLAQSKMLELTGTFDVNDKLTYRSIPFEVPDSIGMIEFDFEYDSKDNEIEIGVFDPDRFRGTSRFSKSTFLIAENYATPSYLYGPILSGTWNISLGFPVINSRGTYTVKVRMTSKSDPVYSGPSKAKLSDEKRWYSGDFHTHSGHSDGYGCKDTEGDRTPCPIHRILESAHEVDLDFVAVADHNTISHYQDLISLQSNYPRLLLLRSQELTTFYGHAVVHGSTDWIDFRLGPHGAGILNVQKTLIKQGSLISIVHPGRETGDSCTGCGWTVDQVDFDLLDAIEIVNGDEVETTISGIPFWHEQLNKGFKITGIGGSDDHSAGFGSVKPGTPTTVVWSNGLSEFDLLEGVRSGKVYIKTNRTDRSQFRYYATNGTKTWELGEVIDATFTGNLNFVVWMDEKFEDVDIIVDGEKREINCRFIQTDHGYQCEFSEPDSKYRWVRVNIRDSDKQIRVISNPIYIGGE